MKRRMASHLGTARLRVAWCKLLGHNLFTLASPQTFLSPVSQPQWSFQSLSTYEVWNMFDPKSLSNFKMSYLIFGKF